MIVSSRIPRDCERCGGPIVLKSTGRPPKYCSAACRVQSHMERKREADIEAEVERRIAERDAAKFAGETDG